MQKVFDVWVTTVDDDLVTIVAQSGDFVIETEVQADEIVDVNDLANWLLVQPGEERVTNEDLQKRHTIEYHTEKLLDPSSGKLVDRMVVDSVASVPIPVLAPTP